jgi:hypothetical protein
LEEEEEAQKKMKRTRAKRQQEEQEAIYTDPVTMAAPTRPLVLTECGHPVDESYLDTLKTRAQETKNAKGYCCLVCDTVSKGVVRNFALEEALGLGDVSGPAKILAHPPRKLVFVSPGELVYRAMSKYMFDSQIKPLVERVGQRSGESGVCRVGIEIHNRVEDIILWLEFENGRYKTEFVAEFGLEIAVAYSQFDLERTLENVGRPWCYCVCGRLEEDSRAVWVPCDKNAFLAAPRRERGLVFSFQYV